MEEAPADDDSAVVSNGTRCAPPPEANVRFRPALAGPLVRPPLTALLPPAAEAEAEALPPAFSLFNAVGSYIVAGLQRIMNVRSNPARANDQISAMIGRAVCFSPQFHFVRVSLRGASLRNLQILSQLDVRTTYVAT